MQIDFKLVDFLLVLPAVALFLASLVPLLIKVLRGNQEQNTFATLIYSYVGVVIAAGFTCATVGSERTAFDGALVFDGISSFTTIIILIVTAVSLTIARD